MHHLEGDSLFYHASFPRAEARERRKDTQLGGLGAVQLGSRGVPLPPSQARLTGNTLGPSEPRTLPVRRVAETVSFCQLRDE